MKVRRIAAFLLAGILLAYCCAGCSDTAKKEETPTTITVWHVYGGQTDSPLNDLIDAFNQTVGKEQRINVQVTSVSNTSWCWPPLTESRAPRSCPTSSSPIPRR